MPPGPIRLDGHPTATAIIEGEVRVTYGELHDRVLRTAGALMRLELPADARVAVAAGSTSDGVVGYLGAQAAGLLPVMLSPRSPAAEMQRRFDDVDPALVIVASGRELQLPDGVRRVRPAGSSADDAEVLQSEPIAAPVVGKTNDPAVALYTSGVSGLPRAIVLTHGNLAATRAGVVDGPDGGLDPSSVAFGGLPMAHVFGLNSVIGSVLQAGGKLVLHEEFEPAVVAELIARHRVTTLTLVPLMWKALAGVGDASLFSTVNRATYSAAAMPAVVAEAVGDLLDVRVAGGFGLTETAGTICQDDPSDPTRGSVGRILGGNELRVVDDGDDALPGDTGEILLKGPSVAKRYLDGSPVSRSKGWFRTGDIGALSDDGKLSIVNRQKDVINVSGFNVSPSEVEWALAEHPAVATSVVVGDAVDDQEVVVAHVVLKPGVTTTEDELRRHCGDHLSRYKVPSRIQIRDDIPITDSGKAIRRLLADQA